MTFSRRRLLVGGLALTAVPRRAGHKQSHTPPLLSDPPNRCHRWPIASACSRSATTRSSDSTG